MKGIFASKSLRVGFQLLGSIVNDASHCQLCSPPVISKHFSSSSNCDKTISLPFLQNYQSVFLSLTSTVNFLSLAKKVYFRPLSSSSSGPPNLQRIGLSPSSVSSLEVLSLLASSAAESSLEIFSSYSSRTSSKVTYSFIQLLFY